MDKSCMWCGKPTKGNKKRQYCSNSCRSANSREAHRLKGLCVNCTNLVVPGRVLCKRHCDYMTKFSKDARILALQAIANYHNRPVQCMYDLVLPPNHPLRQHRCYGDLWIEHRNGGGKQDRNGQTTGFYRKIIIGRRPIDDLALLCQLHQLWNQ